MPVNSTNGPGAEILHPDPLLSAKEGAPLIGVSEPTFWRYSAHGIIPKPIKIGGLSRWPRSELLAVIERAKANRSAA